MIPMHHLVKTAVVEPHRLDLVVTGELEALGFFIRHGIRPQAQTFLAGLEQGVHALPEFTGLPSADRAAVEFDHGGDLAGRTGQPDFIGRLQVAAAISACA